MLSRFSAADSPPYHRWTVIVTLEVSAPQESVCLSVCRPVTAQKATAARMASAALAVGGMVNVEIA